MAVVAADGSKKKRSTAFLKNHPNNVPKCCGFPGQVTGRGGLPDDVGQGGDGQHVDDPAHAQTAAVGQSAAQPIRVAIRVHHQHQQVEKK